MIDKEYTEQWPYHSVAAIIRAHSLIRSFPEVDKERTAITGISWGGYLTCMVVGLDNRFKAAVPVYGCGYLNDNAVWDNCFNKLTPEQCKKWTSLWDPAQYLPATSMPILFMNGTNDFAYPLDIYMKSYDLVPGNKQMCVTVYMPHSHPAGWAPKEIGLFIDQHLLDKPALPAIEEITVKDGVVTGEVTNDVKLSKAELHFTSDKEVVNRRKWTTVPAKIDGRTITAEGLPADANAYFLTVRDDRDGVVSSRVELAKP
jgi:PhoPQ-activated pathogenicity-related protein